MSEQADFGQTGATLYAPIAAAESGNNTLVAAVAGKKIRVVSCVLVMTGTAVTCRLESGADGTALSGLMTPAQGSAITFAYNPAGWFETAAGSLLNLELGGAQAVAGALAYRLV